VPERSDRTFVVTGAASGIGLAVARRLLAEGGTVVGTDVSAPPDLGEPFSFVTADVSDEAAVAKVFAAVPDRLDGVVHAAGVASGGPVHLLDKTEWDRVIAINLTGTFLVAKAALSRMIEQPRVDGERGSLVTLASVEGLEGTAGGSGYNAAWQPSSCRPTRRSSPVRRSPSTVATPPVGTTALSSSSASPSESS
jgi:NAD(P)-dependent dehydrogenase (short-subunit alcohol dehydrogenase family)